MSETYNRELLAPKIDELIFLAKALEARNVLDVTDELCSQIYGLFGEQDEPIEGESTALSNEQILVKITGLESRLNTLIKEKRLDRRQLLESGEELAETNEDE